MANQVYSNFYLSNEIEDQFNSYLDLQRFCTVDNELEGTAGMIRKINRYHATNATQKLTMGQGNNQSIEVAYSPYQYEIQLAQNRFEYFDEEDMTDPMLVPTGARHMATDMFNTVNGDIYGEFAKATQVVVVASFDFDAFADAQSMFPFEDIEGIEFFAFVHPTDVAALRKALKTSLQYVESFARSGYIGTVAGVNIYTKKDANIGTICLATKEAVTIFNKRGTEVEQPPRDAGDANIRKNTIFARKYYVCALTDENKAVKIVKGSAAASVDTSVQTGKTYYEASGLGYLEVVPAAGDNPATKGWYEITAA